MKVFDKKILNIYEARPFIFYSVQGEAGKSTVLCEMAWWKFRTIELGD